MVLVFPEEASAFFVDWTPMAKRKRLRRQSISSSDFRNLEQMLASKPVTILKAFRAAQVSCLVEVDAYHRILRTQPEAASRIRIIAALMGIPEVCALPADGKALI